MNNYEEILYKIEYAQEVLDRCKEIIADKNETNKLSKLYIRADIVNTITYKLMNNLGGNNIVISDDEEKVAITKEEYDELIERDEILSALEQGGVDNWEWYGESLSQYFEEED